MPRRADKGLICPAAQGQRSALGGRARRHRRARPAGLARPSQGHVAGRRAAPRSRRKSPSGGPDLAQVKGQEIAKRALEIAAAGGHNLLMSGPPGAGKSLLAACLPGILPPLQPSEALEVSMVASVAGELERRPDQPQPAVPRAAPQRLDAGAGRRRAARPAGRDQPRASRRAVPRRAARVPAPGARFAAPAARDRHGQRRPRQRPRHLSGAGPAGRGDEPVPLRPSRRSRAGLQPRAALRRRLPGAGLGPVARPHRPPCRSARRVRPPTSTCRRRPKAAPRSRARRRRARRSRPSATTARAATNAEADGELARPGRDARRAGPQAARRGRRGDAPVGARLSPRACASRGPSPTWRAPRRSAGSTSPRRSATAASRRVTRSRPRGGGRR